MSRFPGTTQQSTIFEGAMQERKQVNSTNHIAAQKLLECKAYHRKQGEGDLTIVEPLSRNNAAVNNF